MSQNGTCTGIFNGQNFGQEEKNGKQSFGDEIRQARIHKVNAAKEKKYTASYEIIVINDDDDDEEEVKNAKKAKIEYQEYRTKITDDDIPKYNLTKCVVKTLYTLGFVDNNNDGMDAKHAQEMLAVWLDRSLWVEFFDELASIHWLVQEGNLPKLVKIIDKTFKRDDKNRLHTLMNKLTNLLERAED